MLSPELLKPVEDGALRYFTREQLQQRSRFDDDLDFLQSLEQEQPESSPFKLHVTLEGDRPQKVTITIE
ncbi:hypothetical protein [Rhizobium miluonense]|uniref:Uncharacterized protein n=1 Tax=Rhizobium miluonense TaxID=411945 RepID=A0ABU1SR89_9HYPH|nr:hypothetical protein [Rhizobium miluonense]MDR6901495.1 hypothetical protein [Rhizobium miluonense]